MFAKTNYPYRFKYLQTGINGPGIDQVYLPEPPLDNEIHFKKEQKFIRPEMPPQINKWVREWRIEQKKNPNYVHAKYDQIIEWENQQWERCRPDGPGFHFYNGYEDGRAPEVVWLTPFHYWYLTEWNPYFGKPDFRDSDKEIFYWILYCEEDPDCFGGLFNTIRRYAKSTIMGAWIVWRTTMNFNHNSGMQGETDKKIAKFYKKMVLKPFYKLRYYMQPTYNTDTKQANAIEFDLPPQRSEKRNAIDLEDRPVLESMIDFRASSEGEYDGDILNSYIAEEPAKHKKTSLYNSDGEGLWDIIKPCFLQGDQICGKALFGTTVENLKVEDKGGAAYKKLFFDSNFNDKQQDGRTVSGLYTAFLPGDCGLKGYFDEYGRPQKEKARARLLLQRDSLKNNKRKLAGLIRKYPLTIVEIFYVSPDRCEFDATILQDRLQFIDSLTTPIVSGYDLYWQDNKRFGKVAWRHNPTGWFRSSWMPTKDELQNVVGKKFIRGVHHYYPKNELKICSGMDPTQFGSTGKSTESRPVQFVKLKYDSAIDGVLDEELLKKRAEEKYDYKTNKYFGMMHERPSNPNTLAERCLMICWLFGCSVHIEKQHAALIIGYFYTNNCEDFIMNKYVPEHEKQEKNPTEGTSASVPFIQEYTGQFAWYIDYFGHTLVHREQIEDALIFDAANTKVHDYTVASGYTETGEKVKPKNTQRPILDLGEIFS